MPLTPAQEDELTQTFLMYCIYDPETDTFTRQNVGTIPTSLLGNCLRAMGCCPMSDELKEAEASIGGATFDMNKLRPLVESMVDKEDSADDIITAFDTMAEGDHPDGCIDKEMLWRKMNRRFNDEALTTKMCEEDGKPQGGFIDYKDFVMRMFAVKQQTFKSKEVAKSPTVDETKAMLMQKYGFPDGPQYPYAYKSTEELLSMVGR